LAEARLKLSVKFALASHLLSEESKLKSKSKSESGFQTLRTRKKTKPQSSGLQSYILAKNFADILILIFYWLSAQTNQPQSDVVDLTVETNSKDNMSIDLQDQAEPQQQPQNQAPELTFSADETLKDFEFSRLSSSSTPPESTSAFNLQLQAAERPLTLREFVYSVGIINEKVDATFQLCHAIADEQKELSKAIKKLVDLDELSDGF